MVTLIIRFCILLGLISITAPAFAHSQSHSIDLTKAARHSTGSASADAFSPVYLQAGVCSLHARHDEEAFERRVELIRHVQAREPLQDDEVTLYDNLGDHSYPISTNNALAQQYFDQGLRLAYAFNHYEAWRSFKKAQELDSNCAMCYWGEAWVLGPNINAPMEPAAVEPAITATRKAETLAGRTTERERALIKALSERYSSDPQADQMTLNRSFADAMTRVVKRFPDDTDITSIYADALMNLSPWDYWEPDGETLKAPVANLVNTLTRTLAKAPDHPYAIHLYIHTMEASKSPERAESHADRLGALMPGAGHLVHMPFHIYFNIGRFQDAIAINKDAVAADEAYLANVSDNDLYALGYYPHNVHSLLESARMAGDAKTALKTASQLPNVMSKDLAAKVPWIQVIYAAPYFAHAQFSEHETTISLPDPGDRFPYVKAMWHYARGVAYAQQGNTRAARKEVEAIEHLEDTADLEDLIAGGVPAPNLLSLARHITNGRISQAEGRYDEAVMSFSYAVDIQNGLPYLEPPYWYYPVSQTLGAALLQAGQAQDAEAVFRKSLEKVPNNGWALYGLQQAHKAQGNDAAAVEVEERLNKAWSGDHATLTLARL